MTPFLFLPINQIGSRPTDWYLDPTTIIAIGSALIAFGALLFSIIESRRMKKHQILSVKPRIELSLDFETDGPLRLYIQNVGLGPASLESIQLEIRDRFFHVNHHDMKALKEFLLGIKELGFPQAGPKAVALSQNTIIRAGEEISILEWGTNEWSENEQEWLNKFCESLKLHLIYRDLYETQFDRTIDYSERLGKT